jgi:type I restriction enzyme M protein
MARTRPSINSDKSNASLGFEAKLWQAADKLRNNMDAAEYKHVVLGLIFLKYISDTFEEHHAKLKTGKGDFKGANPEDKDEYLAANVFWVPKEARWAHLQSRAKFPTIGKDVDDAMVALERDNPRLKGSLNKNYGRADLDKQRLGELIDLIGSIQLLESGNRSQDILGRVFEYFLTQFASAEGKNGGQFYTPSYVVRCLVEMLTPYKGRIYDPACGSGGMFVQSEKFVEAHGGTLGDIVVYGQESNPTTRRLAVMNLALRGIEADFGPEAADTFRHDLHPDLRADFVLANPPFNDSDWARKDDDVRWKYGVPPKGNANFAWVQHFIHHLAPNGMAGFVLANGSMSSNQSGEGEIRKAIIEADLVDCMVALPGQLFYSTQIPVCLWFLAKDKRARKVKRSGQKVPDCMRDRSEQTLFIDARKMGTLVDRVHRELTEADIEKITSTYHEWRFDDPTWRAEAEMACATIPAEAGSCYQDIPGFCKSATTAEIAAHGYVLTPGRYVGAEEVEDDGDPFEEKMPRLLAELHAQFAESAKLEKTILANLKSMIAQ